MGKNPSELIVILSECTDWLINNYLIAVLKLTRNVIGLILVRVDIIKD